MQLEFHQLDRRWEHLRVRSPQRQRRLLASLADAGQQTPIAVVAAAGQPDCYLVIDGYKRMAALQQLGRDTVEAVIWPMSEAEALLLGRSLRFSQPEQSNIFFKLMEERYHRHSTIITTNLEYDEWHNFLGNKPMVEALLSRVRHYCHTVRIPGRCATRKVEVERGPARIRAEASGCLPRHARNHRNRSPSGPPVGGATLPTRRAAVGS
jgi:uncharacterized ParB-like nuclease family protein